MIASFNPTDKKKIYYGLKDSSKNSIKLKIRLKS